MLRDKRIIVTGATRGIGDSIARACVEAGAVVGYGYRVANEHVQRISSMAMNNRFVPLQFDVRDAASVAKAFAEFRERFGHISGLVNNAGVNRPDLLLSASAERIREQIDVNLVGPILCMQAALPIMLEQGYGVIVNISSVAAVQPVKGQAVYAATKGGVESLTRAAALEYARKGIRVVGIRPGPVATEMMESTTALAGDEVLSRIPLRRLGKPEDIASLAVFLLSDAASFITGSIHTIDGGYLEA